MLPHSRRLRSRTYLNCVHSCVYVCVCIPISAHQSRSSDYCYLMSIVLFNHLMLAAQIPESHPFIYLISLLHRAHSLIPLTRPLFTFARLHASVKYGWPRNKTTWTKHVRTHVRSLARTHARDHALTHEHMRNARTYIHRYLHLISRAHNCWHQFVQTTSFQRYKCHINRLPNVDHMTQTCVHIVSHTHTLWFYPTQLEDPADLGNYTCEATHRSSSSIYQAKYHVTRSSHAQGRVRPYSMQ